MDVFIKKINATVTVDWAALPEAVQAHLIEYGVRQKLADSLSDMAVAKGHTVEEMAFAINELIARLYEGELGSRGRQGDPVAARAKAIAQGMVKAQSRAALTAAMRGREMSFDDIKAELVKRLAATSKIIEMAKAQIEAESASPAIDLDSLMA